MFGGILDYIQNRECVNDVTNYSSFYLVYLSFTAPSGSSFLADQAGRRELSVACWFRVWGFRVWGFGI